MQPCRYIIHVGTDRTYRIALYVFAYYIRHFNIECVNAFVPGADNSFCC